VKSIPAVVDYQWKEFIIIHLQPVTLFKIYLYWVFSHKNTAKVVYAKFRQENISDRLHTTSYLQNTDNTCIHRTLIRNQDYLRDVAAGITYNRHRLCTKLKLMNM
jgi:hypothetical protein